MRRADRLFEIIQVLRRARTPLTADAIARELEISQRTVYRDLATLMSQRVPIRGEAGVGYVLERGFDLPPLMLKADEVEAVVLGSQWVVAHADAALSRAALDVLAKIAAVLPTELRDLVDDPVVGTPPSRNARDSVVDVAQLRASVRQGKKIEIVYRDEARRTTTRIVWPFLVGYVEGIRVVLAWCELRADFRAFRLDRTQSITFLEARYPERRRALHARWNAQRRPDRHTPTGPR